MGRLKATLTSILRGSLVESRVDLGSLHYSGRFFYLVDFFAWPSCVFFGCFPLGSDWPLGMWEMAGKFRKRITEPLVLSRGQLSKGIWFLRGT